MPKQAIENAMRFIVRDKITPSDFECRIYASDFIPISPWVKSFFKTAPMAVVKPGSMEEVRSIMCYRLTRGIPPLSPGEGAPPDSSARS